jgi:hypothetical protein
MTDKEYQRALRQASIQARYGLYRTLALGASAFIMLVKAVLHGSTQLIGIFVLTLVITWQSWSLYRAGRRTFEMVAYFGEKFSGGEQPDMTQGR